MDLTWMPLEYTKSFEALCPNSLILTDAYFLGILENSWRYIHKAIDQVILLHEFSVKGTPWFSQMTSRSGKFCQHHQVTILHFYWFISMLHSMRKLNNIWEICELISFMELTRQYTVFEKDLTQSFRNNKIDKNSENFWIAESNFTPPKVVLVYMRKTIHCIAQLRRNSSKWKVFWLLLLNKKLNAPHGIIKLSTSHNCNETTVLCMWKVHLFWSFLYVGLKTPKTLVGWELTIIWRTFSNVWTGSKSL